MKYIIELLTNKPKNDINDIVKTIGYKNVNLMRNRDNMIARFFVKFAAIFSVLFRMRKGDTLLLQYPLKKFYKISCIFAHWRGGKVITLIHDLGAFRRHKLTPKQEIKLLANSDYIIVHNESMKSWLIEQGCKIPLYCLEIFDYLSPSDPREFVAIHKPWRVVVASGLARRRSGFLYDLDSYMQNWEFDIYGPGFEEEFAKNWTKIKYKGVLPPDDLVAAVDADFGLVWDGDSADECIGDWGSYLKINNPHKTSFYLRCGLPIIIWDKAAMAPFIKNNNVGLCVDSLKNINTLLYSISENEYNAIRENAKIVGQRIADGYYTKKAIAAAEEFLQSK